MKFKIICKECGCEDLEYNNKTCELECKECPCKMDVEYIGIKSYEGGK